MLTVKLTSSGHDDPSMTRFPSSSAGVALGPVSCAQGGAQVNQQDAQVAHRHILATTPRITTLDNLNGWRGRLVIRHPQVSSRPSTE